MSKYTICPHCYSIINNNFDVAESTAEYEMACHECGEVFKLKECYETYGGVVTNSSTNEINMPFYPVEIHSDMGVDINTLTAPAHCKYCGKELRGYESIKRRCGLDCYKKNQPPKPKKKSLMGEM